MKSALTVLAVIVILAVYSESGVCQSLWLDLGYVGLGKAQLQGTGATTAGFYFRHVLERDPGSLEAVLGLAEALFAQGRPGDAQEVLPVGLSPQKADKLGYRLADLYYRIGDLKQAGRIWGEGGWERSFVMSGDLAMNLLLYKKAEEDYSRALLANPTYPQALYGLCDVSVAQGEPRNHLVVVCGNAVEHDAGDSFRKAMTRGEVARWTERWDEAIASYSHAIELNRAAPSPYYMLGWVYLYGTRQFQEARQWLQYGLERFPNDVSIILTMGETFQVSGDPTAAREWFSRAVDADPKNPYPYIRLGSLALSTGSYDEASHYLGIAEGLEASSAEIHFLQGLVFSHQGKLADSLARLGRAVELAPYVAGYRRALIGLYLDSGDLAHAGESYCQSIYLSMDRSAFEDLWHDRALTVPECP